MGEPDEFDLVDRPDAILTRKDRKYLRGEFTPSSSSNERMRRHRMRKRLRNARWDLYILHETMPLDDVYELFGEIYDWHEERAVAKAQDDEVPPVPMLIDAWKGSIQFLVFGLLGFDIGQYELDNAIADAIYQHELHFNATLVDVPVRVQVDYENADEYTLDEIEELVANDDLPDDPVTADQMLKALAWDLRITEEEYRDLLDDVLEE